MIKHLFREPAFASARSLLMQSETGRGVVQQLERLATRTRVTGIEAARTAPADAIPARFGAYRPVDNLLSVDALSLRDELTGALTVGHEGVHRIRRFQTLSSLIVAPFRGLPDAAVGAAHAVRTGRNPLAAAARAIDARTLHEEVVAFGIEARIAKELGAAGSGGGSRRTRRRDAAQR